MKCQSLYTSMDSSTVRTAILKLWSFMSDFTLSLLNIFLCIYPPQKKEHCAILNNVHCSFLMLPHSGLIMVSRASLLMNLIPEGWGQAAPCLNQPMSSILTCNMAWQPWNCPVPPDLTHSLQGTTMTAIFLNLWSSWILRRTELSRQNEPHS